VLESVLQGLGWTVLPRATREPAAGPRVLMYAASNVGLGHLMRLVTVARRLRAGSPPATILLLTDAPPDIADDVPTLRFPGYRFRPGTFQDEPVHPGLSVAELHRLRVNALLAAAHAFQPDVFLMDTLPHGKRDELKPALARLPPATIRVLQLRDIPFVPDEPAAATGLERLRTDGHLYDRVFIAGDPRFFAVEDACQLSEPLRRKLDYLGFVVPDAARDVLETGAPARRTIVVSCGGGWEAGTLVRHCLEGFEHLINGAEPYRLLLFTGPRIEAAAFAELERLVAGRPDVALERFTSSFPAILRQADLAVLQAGSTPFQILDTDIPMILCPRDFRTAEQQYRAARLTAFPGIEVVDREGLARGDIGRLMRTLLTRPRVRRQSGFRFDGAEEAVRRIRTLVERPQ